MSLEPWSNFPQIDTIDPTDKLMRRTPSQTVKNQEIGINETVDIAYHTGVLSGLGLSVASDTNFDMAAGTALFVNRDPDPLNTVATRVTRASITNVADPFLSDPFTYVFLDINDTLILRLTGPTSLDDLNDLVFVGQIQHAAGIITGAFRNAIVAYGSSSSHIAELVFAGGVRLGGGDVSPNGANLNLDITAGIFELYGRGVQTNANNPNEFETLADITPIVFPRFIKSYIDGTGEMINDNTTNSLDPTLFNEDGLGTLETVSPANNYTVQRAFWTVPFQAIIVYYGTKEYASAAEALSAPEPTFVEHLETTQLAPLFNMAIKGDVTDLAAAIVSGDAEIELVSRRV